MNHESCYPRAYGSFANNTPKPLSFEGRPNRETTIGDDDLTTLKIELGRANSVDEFLAAL